MKLQVPPALKADHEELHAQLAAATRAGGAVGAAAKTVAAVLHPHFVKEEEFALPPLGVLQRLAAGRVSGDTAQALEMSERVRRDLKRFLAEHRAIVVTLKRLAAAAKREHREEYARLAQKVILHAQTEEQVLYPAAILIGSYLKLARTHTRPPARRRRSRG